MRHRLPEKLYYSIGEVAEAFEVKPSLIRFWEKEFQIINPKKNQSGTRKFSAKDIEKFDIQFRRLRTLYYIKKFKTEIKVLHDDNIEHIIKYI